MFSVPNWLAEEKKIDGSEERGRTYFFGEEVRRTEKAILLRILDDVEVWLPLSQVQEHEE